MRLINPFVATPGELHAWLAAVDPEYDINAPEAPTDPDEIEDLRTQVCAALEGAITAEFGGLL